MANTMEIKLSAFHTLFPKTKMNRFAEALKNGNNKDMAIYVANHGGTLSRETYRKKIIPLKNIAKNDEFLDKLADTFAFTDIRIMVDWYNQASEEVRAGERELTEEQKRRKEINARYYQKRKAKMMKRDLFKEDNASQSTAEPKTKEVEVEEEAKPMMTDEERQVELDKMAIEMTKVANNLLEEKFIPKNKEELQQVFLGRAKEKGLTNANAKKMGLLDNFKDARNNILNQLFNIYLEKGVLKNG